MPLTKKQREQISSALYHLQRAKTFIERADVEVARKGKHATTTLHFIKPNSDETLYPIDKGIGSDLTGLHDAEHILQQILNPPTLIEEER